ncbi:alpha/beta hydrolase [Nitriliruptoraceae bacterium ZYF776]|nr:alpha/beta hydrolase [Profundirhabdus halotolerans]
MRLAPGDVEVTVAVGPRPARLRGRVVGDGAGPVVLVLHGGGPGCSASSDFAAVIEPLAADRQLLLLDLVQMGRSDFVPIAGPVWSTHADAVAAVLDQLALAEVDVVAQSMGSAVAVALADAHPGRVRRAVLTSFAPFTPGRIEQLGGDPDLGARAWRTCFADGAPGQTSVREVLATYEWADPAAIPEALVRARTEVAAAPHQRRMSLDRSLRGAPEDLEPRLAELDLHASLLWGEHDPFVTPAMRAAVVAALRPAEHTVVPGTSHHLQSEAPGRWLSSALPFLAG